jgi:hypothetical protein
MKASTMKIEDGRPAYPGGRWRRDSARGRETTMEAEQNLPRRRSRKAPDGMLGVESG